MEIEKISIDLAHGQKLYFASDFHLGVPSHEESAAREARIIRWLNDIKNDARAIFLVGDLFDFWHEYKYVVPKGFVRFQGKLAELADSGVAIHIFIGNHDLWMFDYFKEELGALTHKGPVALRVNGFKMLIAHGDGLGPGDKTYKLLKKIFQNSICQWLFRQIHPDLGIRIANRWSASSRISSSTSETEKFLGEGEWLLTYAKEVEKKEHFDFYIFGHRHLPIDVEVSEDSRYINLGEWVNYDTFASFDGKTMMLQKFEESASL